jgi:hypothetical protein
MLLRGLIAVLVVEVLVTLAVRMPKPAARPGSEYGRVESVEAIQPATAKATFAMGCYYHGEERLGALDGVLTTRAGILDGLEVVEVTYDPKVLPFEKLVEQGNRLECTSRVYAPTDEEFRIAERLVGDKARRLTEPARDAIPYDRLFSLKTSNIKYLPLTPMQATKVNAALGLRNLDPKVWLSPQQLELLKRIEAALARNPHALDGFVRPDKTQDLPEYERNLAARLSGQQVP